jgi:acyl-CoA reductase-like NAD-dependent aldehyde dehydrogenase
VQKVLANYKLGDPRSKDTNVGPVISKAAKERVERQINDAIQKGAKDATPSNSSFSSPPSDGNYVKPTVLTDCTTDMTIMHDETFGPVIPIQSVKSDDEAIDLMNDSEFGLTASIWTKDEARGQEIAEEVEAGTVFVNRADFPSPDLAWTGWKNSGKGQTLSVFGFEQFVKLKNFHVKDYPVK